MSAVRAMFAGVPPYLPATLARPGSQYVEHVINRGRYSERSTARGRAIESLHCAQRLRRDYVALRGFALAEVARNGGRWTREAFGEMRRAHAAQADAVRALQVAVFFRARGPSVFR